MKICSFDIFWHLKTGEYLFENGNVLNHNLFSWTYPDFPWRSTYWLFDVPLFIIYILFSFKGLVIFKAFVLGITYGIVGKILFQNLNRWTAFLFFLLILELSFFRFMIRPHIFTFLGLSLLLLFMYPFKETFSMNFYLKSLLLFAIWANLHSGVVFGLFFIAIGLLSPSLSSFSSKTGSIKQKFKSECFSYLSTKSYSILLVIFCLIVTFCNPYGPYYIRYIWDHLFMDTVIPLEELRSLSVSLHWKQLLMLSIYLGLPLIILWHRKKLCFSHVLYAIFSFILLVKGIRFFPLICFFGAPALLDCGKALKQENYPSIIRSNSVFLLISGLLYVLRLHFQIYNLPESYFESGTGIHEASFPVESCRYISLSQNHKIFNSFSAGGYLIWYFDGQLKVFQDGRIHAYPSTLFKEIAQAQNNSNLWQKLLTKYDINLLLLNKSESTIIQTQTARTAPWNLLHEDENFILAEKQKNINECGRGTTDP